MFVMRVCDEGLCLCRGKRGRGGVFFVVVRVRIVVVVRVVVIIIIFNERFFNIA